MANPEAAFNYIINKQGREVTYKVLETGETFTVKMAQANFSRNFAGPEEITYPGREYVLSVENLERAGINFAPKRNHRVTDSVLGTRVFEEVKEMVILGKIVGYRVRTN